MARKRRSTEISMADNSLARPTVYVFAGPNGAGKTTFVSEFLPEFVKCREFLNADLIAAGLSPFSPERQNVRAGRLLLTRIRELTAAGDSFGFETTLAGRGYVRQFREMRQQGYRVMLFYLWLPSADAAVARVANRVRQGGHDVLEEDIRRRFAAGLRNLFRLYRPLVDAWWLYNASGMPPMLVAAGQGDDLQIMDAELFSQITRCADP